MTAVFHPEGQRAAENGLLNEPVILLLNPWSFGLISSPRPSGEGIGYDSMLTEASGRSEVATGIRNFTDSKQDAFRHLENSITAM